MLGIVGCVVPYVAIATGIIAIVFARRTLAQFDAAFSAGYTPINQKTQRPTNRGLATAGLVLGIVSIALFFVSIILLFSVVLPGLSDPDPYDYYY